MSYIDKTKPSPAWTEEQLYLWHERLAIRFDGGPVSLTHSEYVKLWGEVEKAKMENGKC